ncbi:MAG: selenium-dependent xanthine dehydrogenase [Chloroflexota bacterium]
MDLLAADGFRAVLPAMSPVGLELTVNGAVVRREVAPDTTLLQLLREELGVTSPKDGCSPTGQCGCCTVLLDGKPVTACTISVAKAAGRSVRTIEGLPDAEREAFASAFAANGGLQCGFCIPGIVMRAKSLLAREPSPSREQVAAELRGHLCRCTGYVKIVEAIQLAGKALRGQALPEPDWSGKVGTRLPRYRAGDLALGDKAYVDDMSLPGMLHGALLFSPYPRAIVRSIDVSKAAALPGVLAVVTAGDVPGDRFVGQLSHDWPIFVAVGETTRYVGDVIAAVAADTGAISRQALDLIDVEYEVLEPVTSAEEALKPGSPAIDGQGNALPKSVLQRGDVDAALAKAAHVVRETFRTQFIEHAFLEPESCVALVEDGGMHVYSQGQGVYDDRTQLASVLGVPIEQVRVTQVANGGAFGGKEDLSVQAQTMLLAKAAGRPVKVTLTREESIRLHPKRHPITIDYTMACDTDGNLTAVQASMIGDSGAYRSVGDKVLERACGHGCGPYRVPNVDITAVAVYTNNPPCGAMRGFGANQAAFAVEGCLDMLAEKIGIDRWDIRYRNALDVGDEFATGQVLDRSVGIKQTLLAVKDQFLAAKYAGIACGIKNTGIGNGVPDIGHASLVVEPDGTIMVHSGFTEMGQGFSTVLIQFASDVTGLDPRLMRVTIDTEFQQECGMTTASRATVLAGRAVQRAAAKLKSELDAGKTLSDLAGQTFAGEYVVDWTTPIEDKTRKPVTHLTFGYATQVVVLDESGHLAKVIAAHDVGRVINPALLEGQIEGSLHMGLGYALTEEFVVEGGYPVTTSFRSLGLLQARDMPEVEIIFVEDEEPEGPFGAKGVGEIGLVPTAPAVAAALYAYDQVRRTQLPMLDSPAASALYAAKGLCKLRSFVIPSAARNPHPVAADASRRSA